MKKLRALASFTLIELLTVMAIISILAALTLAAASALWQKAARSRASAEIQAMSTAAEGYKTDNGIYPQSDGVLVTGNYSSFPTDYQTNATLLYIALSGQPNFGTAITTGTAGTKSYMQFKANQLGNPTAAGFSYVIDPWKQPYGYSTGSGTVSLPYNGSGFFDLWSVGNKPSNTNAWNSNWQ